MIAVVVPTIRPEQFRVFKAMWQDLFDKHQVKLLTVWDGDTPQLEVNGHKFTAQDIMGKDADLIYNKNDGVRNLGFAFISRVMPEIEYVITLDDDLYPVEDTIQDHLDALNSRVSINWLSTLVDDYPRGVPYNTRRESPVAISHGVWEGVKDWDAPTQLVRGNPNASFYKGVIPKGTLFPMCGMNLAFKRDLLPYMYFAPMGYRVGMDRFADIWAGIRAKKVCDANNWAVVTGYASVLHDRASNVFTNLKKEARGIELNETFWQGDMSDPYFNEYAGHAERWEKWIIR